jgi:hypothetical protein
LSIVQCAQASSSLGSGSWREGQAGEAAQRAAQAWEKRTTSKADGITRKQIRGDSGGGMGVNGRKTIEEWGKKDETGGVRIE